MFIPIQQGSSYNPVTAFIVCMWATFISNLLSVVVTQVKGNGEYFRADRELYWCLVVVKCTVSQAISDFVQIGMTSRRFCRQMASQIKNNFEFESPISTPYLCSIVTFRLSCTIVKLLANVYKPQVKLWRFLGWVAPKPNFEY